MSRPSGSASTIPVPPPPGRRPQTAQFPGLPSLLRNPTQTGTAAASSSSAPRPASALPSYIRSEASQSSSSPSSLGKGTPAVGSKEKLSLPGRTSKTGAKLVFLPEDVQSKPIPSHPSQLNVASAVAPPKAGERREDEENRGDDRSEAERMSKEEREREGFGRLTAYATADSYRLKSLAKFLGREHGAEVRIFDEAVYAVYTLPLLPGYGANVQIRSSVAVKSPGGGSILHAMDQAEETGYLDSYFALDETVTPPATENHDEPSTSPPVDRRPVPRTRTVSTGKSREPKLAEAIFFDYGVSVFFGFTEEQELTVLNDCSENGLWIEEKKRSAWETEECHFIYDPSAQYPRIFNDLFTFKSPSHLLKLSLSHAIAQSTKLSVYESAVQDTLADTSYIPKELALTGELELDRREAVKLTGRLFRLRVEVNLVSNVLDTPELFWSEASLKLLYDAVREYLEIDGRVHVLNEKLGVAGDLLEIIHEHVDNAGMHRVTWIIIWLIVVACLVEFGEVIARLVFHSVQPEAKARGKSALLTLMQSTSSKLLPIP